MGVKRSGVQISPSLSARVRIRITDADPERFWRVGHVLHCRWTHRSLRHRNWKRSSTDARSTSAAIRSIWLMDGADGRWRVPKSNRATSGTGGAMLTNFAVRKTLLNHRVKGRNVVDKAEVRNASSPVQMSPVKTSVSEVSRSPRRAP